MTTQGNLRALLVFGGADRSRSLAKPMLPPSPRRTGGSTRPERISPSPSMRSAIRGRADNSGSFNGRISVDFAHPDRSSVAFHVQSQSVDVGSQSFDDYLRSVAFLDSGAFSVDRLRLAVRSRRSTTIRSG